MSRTTHFFRDRNLLLLASLNVFLAASTSLLVAIKLYAMRGTVNYTVAYRDKDIVGLDSFTTGTVWDFISFVFAAGLLLTMGLLLAYRTFAIRRELSVVSSALTTVLLLFLFIACWLLLAKQ
jgi:hypothetical protein